MNDQEIIALANKIASEVSTERVDFDEVDLDFIKKFADEIINLTTEQVTEQWEPEWRSQAEANAAGYNEHLSKLKEAKEENKELREYLFAIGRQHVRINPDMVARLVNEALGDE